MTRPLPADLFDPLCPSDLLPFRFGDKWSALVLKCLEDGPRRFGELRPPLRGVTARVLTRTLRGLMDSGFVERRQDDGHARYALTQLGREVLVPLAVLCEWTARHWDELLDGRDGALTDPAGTASVGAYPTR